MRGGLCRPPCSFLRNCWGEYMEWKKIFDPDSVRILPVTNIINKSGLSGSNLSANPYVGCPHACMYCYVPGMKHGPAAECGRWGTYLHVKEWKPLDFYKVRQWAGMHLTIGSSTDPYNPLEPHFRKTRTLLSELENGGLKISIITKSDAVLNDLDILSDFGENVMVAFSINTLDEGFKEDMDAAPSIERRIRAMSICKDAGLLTSCFIAPVFPGITDIPEIIEAVRVHCDAIWVDALNLSSANIGKVTGYISCEYSHLFNLYRRMYKDGDLHFWLEESSRLQEYARKQGLPYTTGKLSMQRAPIGAPAIIDYMSRRARR